MRYISVALDRDPGVQRDDDERAYRVRAVSTLQLKNEECWHSVGK